MQPLCSRSDTAIGQGNLSFVLIRFILSETSPSSHGLSAQARLFSLGTCTLRVVLQLASRQASGGACWQGVPSCLLSRSKLSPEPET